MNPLDARLPDTSMVAWQGLHGSSFALAVASAATASDGVTLVLARSGRQAALLEQDLRQFQTVYPEASCIYCIKSSPRSLPGQACRTRLEAP